MKNSINLSPFPPPSPHSLYVSYSLMNSLDTIQILIHHLHNYNFPEIKGFMMHKKYDPFPTGKTYFLNEIKDT